MDAGELKSGYNNELDVLGIGWLLRAYNIKQSRLYTSNM